MATTAVHHAGAQGDDGQRYRVIEVGNRETDQPNRAAWIDIMPDGETVGLSSVSIMREFPYRTFTLGDAGNVTEIKAGTWYNGSRARFSNTGKYLLLEELAQLDIARPRDQPLSFSVLDMGTKEVVKQFKGLRAACITPDESTVITLDKQGVGSFDLATGTKGQVSIQRSGGAMAISQDGKYLALSHIPEKRELEALHSVRNDRKALKDGLKNGRIVVVYDMATQQPVFTLDALFDRIFRLEYSPDGRDLWIHAKANMRKNPGQHQNQSYLEVADSRTGEMRRTSFPSLAQFEPDFRTSPNGELLAIGSQGNKYMEVHLYDRASGIMLDRFVLDYRLFERLFSGEKFPKNGQISFVFLPDNERIMIAYGNRIVEWTFNA